MRVLVVEDEPLIALDIQEALQRAGMDVVGSAASVEEALNLIRQPCDAVVLDAVLHGIFTEPVAEALRGRGVPFVVLSGYAYERLTSALASGSYVPKPYNSADLIARLRQLTGGA